MSVAAKRYAKALIDVLYPTKAEAGYDELRRLLNILQGQHDARQFLENPTISADRRKGFINQICETLNTSTEVRNFVDILIDRDRLHFLTEIIDAYRQFLDQKTGVERAVLTTAVPLEERQQEQLITKLETATGKKVRMQVNVDPGLLGGLVARVGSTIYDGSLRQQLESFKARLVQE